MKLGGLSKPRGRGRGGVTHNYYQKNCGGSSIFGKKNNSSLALLFILILMRVYYQYIS